MEKLFGKDHRQFVFGKIKFDFLKKPPVDIKRLGDELDRGGMYEAGECYRNNTKMVTAISTFSHQQIERLEDRTGFRYANQIFIHEKYIYS